MSWQFLSEKTHTARTQKKCIWCGQFILAGEKYTRITGLSDGEFQTNPFHPECRVACSEDLRENHEDYFEPYEYERGSRDMKGSRKVVLL